MKTLAFVLFCFLVSQNCFAETASFYSTEACKYNPDPKCPTASGRSLYDLEQEGVLFAAKWDVPIGTRFKVTNTENERSVEVVILDRGPNRRLGRGIDLSKKAFRKIANIRQGVINVTIEELK
jgi:rare lipoprotein A